MCGAPALLAVLLVNACRETPQFRPVPPPCPARMVPIVGLPACIDRYEAAIDERGVAIPATDRRPASAVSYDDARRACRRAGFRLCTGEEWTRACQGEEGRTYPYGASYEPGRCNTAEADSDLSAIEVVPSGTFARCVTPEGVYDLSGNVGEWTDEPDASGRLRELRGGAARNGESAVRCVLDDRGFQPPDEAWEGQGFRCCTDRRVVGSDARTSAASLTDATRRRSSSGPRSSP